MLIERERDRKRENVVFRLVGAWIKRRGGGGWGY